MVIAGYVSPCRSILVDISNDPMQINETFYFEFCTCFIQCAKRYVEHAYIFAVLICCIHNLFIILADI